MKSNRDPQDIQIIAVTKTFPFSAIQSAYNNNIFIIGENRVQETIDKISHQTLPNNLELHLIGHLQSNKVKKAINIFDVIQTVDSLKLAHKINNAACEMNKIQRIYIQINTGNDNAKFGFNNEEVINVAKEINSFSNIQLEGIMMIPPFLEMNKKYRDIFKKTKKIQLNIYNSGIKNCIYISMGMSRDYEMSVEEGATHIRIGTALFGHRE